MLLTLQERLETAAEAQSCSSVGHVGLYSSSQEQISEWWKDKNWWISHNTQFLGLPESMGHLQMTWKSSVCCEKFLAEFAKCKLTRYFF